MANSNTGVNLRILYREKLANMHDNEADEGEFPICLDFFG